MSLETLSAQCPYCGETIEIDVEALDDTQEFIEDCTVCCRPIQFEASKNDDGEMELSSSRSD